MTEVRVGKREVVGSSPIKSKSHQTGAFGKLLASPYGILLIFPGIVFSVGLFLTLIAQGALRGSNLDMAQQRMTDQATLVADHLHSALQQADPLLDALEAFSLTIDSGDPPEASALVLRDLLRGRLGVSYVSISFPDGVFKGAFIDDDGVIRFLHSRKTGEQTLEKVFDYQGRGALRFHQNRVSQYDPRVRPFYRLAVKSQGHVWTEPYTFAGTQYTGITRTAAVYRNDVGAIPQLHAVLTADFDVQRLSPLLQRRQIEDGRALLFSGDGTLLADSHASKRADLQTDLNHVLHYRDLNDAVLTGFFTQRNQEPGVQFFDFSAVPGRRPRQHEPSQNSQTEQLQAERQPAEQNHLAATVRLSDDPTLDWAVAYIVPEATFLASLRSYSRRSYFIAGLAVLLAVGVSILFARLIVRVRREAADARAAALQAKQTMRELGSYRLIECLGKGGMGEVWRAEHRLLARQAAIKLIRQDEESQITIEAQERFRREAQSLASLRSRNTIELFDYGVAEDGTFFYVMELLDGLDLETLVVSYGVQSPARVVRLLAQACRSLAEAHEAGLVHRDVKPANLFVCRVADELDVVKVLDFGLVRSVTSDNDVPLELSAPAQAAEPTESATRLPVPELEPDQRLEGNTPQLTRAGNLMGTPAFMAPEQILGGEVDARADLYALGGVAVWLLTGRSVFKGGIANVLRSHLYEAPPPIADVCPHPLPQSFAELIHACLAKSPKDRPQTAREILQHLKAIEKELGGDWDAEAVRWWKAYNPAGDNPSLSETVNSMETARTVAATTDSGALPAVVRAAGE